MILADSYARTRARAAPLAVSLALVCGAFAFPSAGQTAPEVAWTATTVVAMAREHRPEILAARARTRAAWSRPRIVSSLNDPMVMASIDHLPFRFNVPEYGANFSVMLQQEFPLSNVLGLRGRAAEAGALRVESDTQRIVLDVEYEAIQAFFMVSERRRTRSVLDAQLRISEEIVTLAMARYAAGQGAQADGLRAQHDVTRLRAERAGLDGQVRAAEAMLNAAVGRDATAIVPALRPPDGSSEPPSERDVATQALAHRPEITTMRLSVAQARAEVRVMEAMFWPMMFIRTGFAYAMPEGAGAMLMVGISIPVYRGRLNGGVDEARAMIRMADADVEAMRNMVRGEAVAARAQLVGARARLDSIRREVLPLAEQTITASLASYAAGQIPLVAVVDAVRGLWMSRQDEVMTDVNVGLAQARLDRALGAFEDGARR